MEFLNAQMARNTVDIQEDAVMAMTMSKINEAVRKCKSQCEVEIARDRDIYI